MLIALGMCRFLTLKAKARATAHERETRRGMMSKIEMFQQLQIAICRSQLNSFRQGYGGFQQSTCGIGLDF